jgi:DegV family protein with EDD domain
MIAIVCDSTVYMTQKEAEEFGVVLAPVSYYTPQKSFDETFIDKSGDFEQFIDENNCKTSHTNPAVFLSLFKKLLGEGYEILCVTISSRLSGTYSSARVAAKEAGGDKIMVVDSLSTAGGLFMLVKLARRLIDEGRSLIETAMALEEARGRINIVFTVNDMKPLRKSGRLGIVRQSIGTILNVRPILKCFEGTVAADGTVRGGDEQAKNLANRVPLDAEEVYIHYINNYNMTARLTKALKERGYGGKITLRKLGPVLGIHLGTSVTGLVWEEK